MRSRPLEVRHLGEGRSHWVAAGPAGTSVTWDAEITVYEPNRRLAWRSTPSSMIENAGLIHFDAYPDGSTRVHLRWSYNPPAGADRACFARSQVNKSTMRSVDGVQDTGDLECFLRQATINAVCSATV